MPGLTQKVQLMLDQAARDQLVAQMKAAGQQGMAGFKQGMDAGVPGVKSTTQGLGKDFDDVGAKGTKAAGGLSGAWTSFKGVMAGMGVTLGFMTLKNFIGDMFTLGSTAEETASKFKTTFGPAAEGMQANLDMMASKMGLSDVAAQEFSATVAAMAIGMGASHGAAADFSTDILKLAGDFTSFSNAPIEETFGAIRSGLVGQYEPLRRFGVVLSQADVNTRALLMTGKAHEEQLTALEKSQAALTLMYERAGPALGDLDRTQDSTANTARRLSAEWENMKTGLANRLMPAFGQILTVIDQNRESIGALVGVLGTILVRAMDATVATVKEVVAIFEFLRLTFTNLPLAAKASWDQFLADMASWAAKVFELDVKILEVAAKVADALGMKGVAENLRVAAAESQATVDKLHAYAHDKGVEADQFQLQIQENLRGYHAETRVKVEQEAAAGGEAIRTETEKGVEGAKTAIGKIPGAVKDAIVQLSADFRQFWQEDLPNQVTQAAQDTDQIIKEQMDGLDQWLKDQDKARQDEILGRTKERMREETQENRDQEEQQLRDELHHLEQYLARNMGTQAERRVALERTSEIQQDLDALDARNAIAKARETAEGQKDSARDAARATRNTWQDALDAMGAGWRTLGQVFGGIFEGIAGAMDRLIGLVNGVASAIGGAGGQASGLLATLGQIGSTIGVIGALVSAMQVAHGLISDLLGLTEKRQERSQELMALFERAMAGDAAALETLFNRGTVPMAGKGGDVKKELREQAKALARQAYANWLEHPEYGPYTGYHYHQGGLVGQAEALGIPAPTWRLPAEIWGRAPRLHQGGLLSDERPIIAQVGEIILPNHVLGSWETAQAALSAMLAHRGGIVGGTDLSRSFTFGNINVYAQPGQDGPILADGFIREVNRQLGGQLTSDAAQIGRSRL